MHKTHGTVPLTTNETTCSKPPAAENLLKQRSPMGAPGGTIHPTVTEPLIAISWIKIEQIKQL